MNKYLNWLTALILVLGLNGCAVLEVGDLVVSGAVDVVSAGVTVVSTGVKAVGSVLDAVTPDFKSK
jgi:hypothetical protein